MPDNPHMGHRQRMLDKFRRFGLEIFSDHEVLEMLLYFAVRQGDTNPTAHRLMQRFGSLHAVLEATEDELQTVEGVGPRSAELLHLCFALFHRYQADVAKMEQFTDKLNTMTASAHISCRSCAPSGRKCCWPPMWMARGVCSSARRSHAADMRGCRWTATRLPAVP